MHTIYRQKLVNIFCIYTYNFEFLMYVDRGHYNLRQQNGRWIRLCNSLWKSTSRPVAHFSLDERRKNGWLVVCGKLVSSSKNNGLVCKFLYNLVCFISGQDVSNPGLPERARWSYLVSPGLPAVWRKKNFSKSHIINPLLIKLVVQAGLILTSFMDSVLVHEHAN